MKWLIFAILSVLIVIGAMSIRNTDNQTGPTSNKPQTKNNSEPTTTDKPDLIIGSPEAKSTIIEYGDFKCPSCNAFHHQAGKQLREEYINTGKLKIIFRTFPFLGPDSGRGVRGAYCSNTQNKFTQYHDAVFEHMWVNYYKDGDFAAEIEDILSNSLLADISAKVDIDRSKFLECMNSDVQNKNVDADILLAADDNVQGTPTFIINGKRVVGPQPFNVFKTLVDIQLK